MQKNPKGFTLIELLIVIAIIGILASTILVALDGARIKARDAKRIQEISQIQPALELYYAENGHYPISDFDGIGGWDVGNANYPFISNLATFLGQALPVDETVTANNDGYFYYRYSAAQAVNYGCDKALPFYILATKLEGGNSSNSPGWDRCTNGNWGFQWMTGKYEE